MKVEKKHHRHRRRFARAAHPPHDIVSIFNETGCDNIGFLRVRVN